MIQKVGTLPSPEVLQQKICLTPEVRECIAQWREELKKIFSGEDKRKVLVIGPCSADFEESLYEYAEFLSGLQRKTEDRIKIVMRFYTGKPRTVAGWKGLQNSVPGEEPDLAKWVENARRIAVNIIERYSLSLADELLHPQLVEHIGDIYSYFAIGARSTEDQYHREVASGLDFPIGMKNPTSGDIGVMVNSIKSGANTSVYVIGNDIYETSGNPFCHGVLRGGSNGPNYDLATIEGACAKMKNADVRYPAIIVDTNHDNSAKRYEKQFDIMKEVMSSIKEKEDLKNFVKWFMVESYLFDGRQDLSENVKKWLSLTDPCIGKEKTEELVMGLYELLG